VLAQLQLSQQSSHVDTKHVTSTTTEQEQEQEPELEEEDEGEQFPSKDEFCRLLFDLVHMSTSSTALKKAVPVMIAEICARDDESRTLNVRAMLDKMLLNYSLRSSPFMKRMTPFFDRIIAAASKHAPTTALLTQALYKVSPMLSLCPIYYPHGQSIPYLPFFERVYVALNQAFHGKFVDTTEKKTKSVEEDKVSVETSKPTATATATKEEEEEVKTATAALKVYARPVNACHDGYSCDMCEMDPIMGPRFTCTDPACPDYDLCHHCEASGAHCFDHIMMKIQVPIQETVALPAEFKSQTKTSKKKKKKTSSKKKKMSSSSSARPDAAFACDVTLPDGAKCAMKSHKSIV
jgi:hypothetical protein